MKYKVFIDGKEGTTGLRIYDRLSERFDIEILTIPEDLRKDVNKRKELINQSDITFLCLPDVAAIESVSLLENPKTKIIDASTAHRTLSNWAYGFPELDANFLEKIKSNPLVAVPGCHASGFNAIVYPLVKNKIIKDDASIYCSSLSGYSGAGKSMIEIYETSDDTTLLAPRQYAMGQTHKHLKEMKSISGLSNEPIFQPIICNFYSGMLVSIPFLMKDWKFKNIEEVHQFFDNYYKDKDLIQVMPYQITGTESGFLSANELSNYDNMYIYITGNDERVLISALYDNLGKGASGAAIECMNIMLGLDPKLSLNIK